MVKLLSFFLVFGVFPFFTNSTFSSERIFDVSQITSTPATLKKYFTVYEDREQSLTLNDIRKPEMDSKFTHPVSKGENFNFGVTSSAYWLKIAMQNGSSFPIETMLEITYPRLARIDLFEPKGNNLYGTIHSGYELEFPARPYKHRYYIFPLVIPSKSKDYFYLRIKTPNTMDIPVRLWTKKSFHEYERNDYIWQALYFGMAIAMIVYNLILFLSLRDINYLLYVNFGVFTSLTIAAINGIGMEFLWGSFGFLEKIAALSCASLSLGFLLLFMRRMTNTFIILPVFDHLIRVFIGLQFALVIPIALFFNSFIIKLALIVDGTTVLIILCSSFLCILKGNRSAVIFFGAYFVLVICGITTTLWGLGFLHTNPFTLNALQIGSASEMLLLAFALADRINGIQKEKDKAEATVKETLEKNNQLLEQKVRKRTQKLRLANKKLSILTKLDGLTKVANRRHMDETLESEWGRHLREQNPISVILIDIDHFKRFNDHYGHQEGDACLVKVAQALKSSLKRGGDLLARYGGEEFFAILPNTDLNGGLVVAEMMRKKIISLAIRNHETEANNHITISLGAASLVPSINTNIETLIGYADVALYNAKRSGRNQVAYFEKAIL